MLDSPFFSQLNNLIYLYKMKNHYLVKFKTGKVDDNGFDCHSFFVTKRKFKNAREVRKFLTKPIKVYEDYVDSIWSNDEIADVTPCSKDWGKNLASKKIKKN